MFGIFMNLNDKKILGESSRQINLMGRSLKISVYSPSLGETKSLTTSFDSADISENILRQQMPAILDILLLDRTTSKPSRKRNIIWANDNYLQYGKNYQATSQIKPALITGQMGHIIKPRALKTSDMQKKRTKSKAEVFTPTWIVKKQNDILEQTYINDDLSTYK